ncbi:MAG: O-antigen ligase family protein [Methylomicrobium sp.]
MFLFIAFLLLLFGLYGDSGSAIQIVGMMFFIFAGTIDLIKARCNKRLFRLDGATIIICFLVPIFSCFALLLNQQFELIPQTLAFMLCAFAARTLILVNGVEKTIRVFIYAAITMTVLTLIFEYDMLVESLKFSINERGGRVRFSPFDNHPNLTGHIFGLSFLCCALYAYWHKYYRDKLWLAILMISSVACLVILGATSSRGALVGTFLSLFAVYAAHILHGANITRKLIINAAVGVLTVFALAFSNPEKITEYFSELFELNSTYRGFDSGLTGRTDNWSVIVAMSLDSFSGVVFGHGMRSWDHDLYGIATDSSYINSLWESGVFLTASISIMLLRKIYLAGMAERSFVSDFYLAILVFSAMESLVARYLLGIGNPASLMILIILLTPEKMFFLSEYAYKK